MGEHRKGGAVSGERPGVAWGATCGSKMAKKNHFQDNPPVVQER
jgi:hypothetical protein